jgi:transcriptional regulator with XRE-family HTH domain
MVVNNKMNHKFILFYEPSVYFGTMVIDDIDKAFHAALQAEITKGGYGASARLAKLVNLTPTYISRLLRQKGYGSELTRRKIAAALGYGYEEFLNLGREPAAALREAEEPQARLAPMDEMPVLMQKAKEVLESSDTTIREALKSNILAFHESLMDRAEKKRLALSYEIFREQVCAEQKDEEKKEGASDWAV